MKPYIEVSQTALKGADDLYTVFVSEGLLKMEMTVKWENPDDYPEQFRIIPKKCLFLNGIFGIMDVNKIYNEVQYPNGLGTISADPTIVEELFRGSIEPYGIKLNKVAFHSFSFFESEDYTMDPDKEKELFELIIKRCKEVLL
jgi:hypothetical protein